MMTRHTYYLDEPFTPAYSFYSLVCDGCGHEHPEDISTFYGDAHVLPRGWEIRTTHRKGWPRYALAYDLCPICRAEDAQPNEHWDESWLPSLEKRR